MIESKKPVAWIPITLIGVLFLLIGLLGNGKGGLLIVALIILVVAVIVAIIGKKDYQKRVTALLELEASGILSSINESIANGTVKKFQKGKILASETAVLYNADVVCAVELNSIANAYPSNVIAGKYDYDKKCVALECKDGMLRTMYFTPRKNNADFDAFVSFVKSHITVEEEA